MVISIDEYLQKVRHYTVRQARVTSPLLVALETDDDGPSDDPPAALHLAVRNARTNRVLRKVVELKQSLR